MYPPGFIPKWIAYLEYLNTLNPWAVLTGLFSIGAVVLVPRVLPKLPGAFVAILVSTLVVAVFDLPVETISGRFGHLSPEFPVPVVPAFNPALWAGLFWAAFSIALLGALESLLSAVVADGVIGGRHRSNIELIAQGAANIISPLFGGIPATGANRPHHDQYKTRGPHSYRGDCPRPYTARHFFLWPCPWFLQFPWHVWREYSLLLPGT
ncbi:SulP family inorganic anion transporter [Marispirochaeta sp.]|uniref:SulP family inorganic anion transporter n=1 Tax=Marispirochaeta sp. TaxID=2038653 RepID=UPI003748A156